MIYAMDQTSVISFPYKGSTYNAEIQRVDGSIYIFVPDQRLHHILPEGKAHFKLKQGVQLNDQQLTPDQDLILCILGAIDGDTTLH